MKKDKRVTGVYFVKDHYGVTAVFPDEIADNDGNYTCYAHIGQHSACSKAWADEQWEAHPDEYSDLWKELSDRGYNLLLIRRR